MIKKILIYMFLKNRQKIIKKYFEGIEYSNKDFNNKVYIIWYSNFKTNIGIVLGAIGVILSIIGIFI